MKGLKKIAKPEYAVLLAIIFVAVFLRSYQHKNFLTFHMDQARDAMIVGDFVDNGFSKIPFLGPHVTGSTLQLGPAYYYLQSIPAFFLGNNPENFALADWLFSILFIPLLYFFLRLYFSKTVSLLLSAIAATSLFLVIYGRFAWNPNSLPFFTLLALYGLLKTDWKNNLHPGWFYTAIASASIATQLHYVYFFSAPVILIIYIAMWKPNLKIKHYAISFLILLAINSPMIASEIKTGGSNTRLLIENTFKRGISPEEERHNIAEKIFYAFQKLEIVDWQIIASDEHESSISLSKKFLPVCKKQCREDFSFIVLQSIVFIFGIWASISLYRNENDKNRKKFIFSIWLWLGSIFIISIPIIYKMNYYYYLSATALFFALLGFSLQKTELFAKKYGIPSAIILSSIIILFNLKSGLIYIKEHKFMANSKAEDTIGRKFFDDRKITLEQMERAAEYIKENRSPDVPVRIAADGTIARAVFYLVRYQNGIPSCYIKSGSFHPSGNLDYFLVYRISVNDRMPEELNGKFAIRRQEKFGNLIVIDAQAKNNSDQQPIEEDCFTF